MKPIFQYEWKLFLRSKGMIIAWLVMFSIGLYAIYYGHSFQQTQKNTVYSIDTAYHNRVQKMVQNFTADTSTKEGKEAYSNAQDPLMNEWYTHFMLWKQPADLQALSVGQSDNQPFYYYLYPYFNNVYNSKEIELRNPQKLMAGNFDLAFVIIYLFPLLFIVYSYAIISADREAGVSTILAAQGVSIRKIANSRLLFRFLLVTCLFLLLSCFGFLFNGIQSVAEMSNWLIIGLSYLLCWLALMYAIVSLRKSSTITSLLLLCCWILFLLLIPSFVNNNAVPKDAERLEISDADREYSQHLWDYWQSKTTALIDTFYTVMPQWKHYGIKDTNDVNSVAYSYLDILYMNRKGWMNDSSILEMQYSQNKYNFFNPAFVAQRAFNLLAGSESSQFILFKKAAADYHLQRTAYMSVLRLDGKPLSVTDYKAYPVFMQADYGITAKDILNWLWPLWLLSIVMCAIGIAIQKRGWLKNS